MEEKLLIPKIDPPTWDPKNGLPSVQMKLQETENSLNFFLTEILAHGKKILQVNIPTKEIPTWGKTPLLTQITQKGKKRIFHLLYPTLEQTIELKFDLENPALPPEIKKEPTGMLMTKTGFENTIGNRQNQGKNLIATCGNLISKNKNSTKNVIEKIEGILSEFRKNKTTWTKEKNEFEPSDKIKFWPRGFLYQWLKYLSQIKQLHAPKKEVEHIEKDYHLWHYLPSPGEQFDKSTKFLIIPPAIENFLFLKRTVLITALENRPEEVLSFLEENQRYQDEATHNIKNPVDCFLQEWSTTIPTIKGTLVPKLP